MERHPVSLTRPTGGVIALLPEQLLVDNLYLLVSCGPDNRSDGVPEAFATPDSSIRQKGLAPGRTSRSGRTGWLGQQYEGLCSASGTQW
ncbi:MAG: hypothetical protein K9H65_06440 [Bacteroidales bacterium]|nr:hypothetical protein [Bacteroidales bacterium]